MKMRNLLLASTIILSFLLCFAGASLIVYYLRDNSWFYIAVILYAIAWGSFVLIITYKTEKKAKNLIANESRVPVQKLSPKQAAKQFEKVRSMIMAPHQEHSDKTLGEALSICYLTSKALERKRLTSDHRKRIVQLEVFLDTKHLSIPSETGIFFDKARSMTPKEKADFISLIDRLATAFSYWYNRESQ